MTESGSDFLAQMLDDTVVDVRLTECIGALINSLPNRSVSCIDKFPSPEDSEFSAFCQPSILDTARHMIFENSEHELKEMAFLDSTRMNLAVSICDDPEHNLPEGKFLKPPPPTCMQNFDRDDLWQRYQLAYTEWLKGIQE